MDLLLLLALGGLYYYVFRVSQRIRLDLARFELVVLDKDLNE